MSAHEHAAPAAETFRRGSASGLMLILGAGAVIGLIASAVWAFLDQKQFAFSWLFAFAYFFTLCVGCLFWTLVHHATDAEWSVVIRRQMENVASLIPIFALLFIPILICAPILFHWWHLADHPGQDALYDLKKWYLSVGFFCVRAAIYFIGLSGVALLMRYFSTKQDADGHPKHTIWMRKLAFAGLPIFGLSLTFAAFDWLMGLDYHWFSTMWGVYIFAGTAGSSMSLLVLIITALRSQGYLANVVTKEHYHIMGKFMLTFTVFWAYIGFSQYMLIWYANIPEETVYYLRRNTDSWNFWSTALVIGRFFLPFPILLIQGLKKKPEILCWIAGWILLMQLLDIYIVVMPMLHELGFHFSLMDLIAVIAIGCTLACAFLWVLGRGNLFPIRDPRLPESLRLSN